MEANNDNFGGEQEFLLEKARQIIGQCPNESASHSCALTKGGYCPLLASAVRSLGDSAKIPA